MSKVISVLPTYVYQKGTPLYYLRSNQFFIDSAERNIRGITKERIKILTEDRFNKILRPIILPSLLLTEVIAEPRKLSPDGESIAVIDITFRDQFGNLITFLEEEDFTITGGGSTNWSFAKVYEAYGMFQIAVTSEVETVVTFHITIDIDGLPNPFIFGDLPAIFFTDADIPGPPQNVQVDITNSPEVIFSWDPPEEFSPEGYNVYIRYGSGNLIKLNNTLVTDTSFIATLWLFGGYTVYVESVDGILVSIDRAILAFTLVDSSEISLNPVIRTLTVSKAAAQTEIFISASGINNTLYNITKTEASITLENVIDTLTFNTTVL